MMKYVSIVLLVLALGLTSAREVAEGYQVGDVAMDFRLKNIDEAMVSLKDYSDKKGAIVIFTCNHCPYAKMYEQRIIELDKKYAPMGYPVIAINPNDPSQEAEDSFEEMQKRAKEKGYTFPYLVDGTQEIAKTYGATRTPHVYLLKNDGGKFTVAYIGAIDDNHKDAKAVTKRYLEDAIQQVDAGKKVETSFTKAIGCTIKWK